MSRRVCLVVATFALALASFGVTGISCVAGTQPPDGEDDSPYRPGLLTPKLTTPQWVGEPGVEAVVILSIDDLTNNVPKYENFLKPILRRLKAIDGRAPVSVFTCRVDPAAEGLQRLLGEGVSFEAHTMSHPCPCLQKGDFDEAARTYHDCVDLVGRIPNNLPTAFRMPCCDSMNSVSPRFFSEIFNRESRGGRGLSIDSSVFNILTPDDPALPSHVARTADGLERFRKYLPERLGYVNLIQNHPYPYVIKRRCWEFPCVVPSDWEAQSVQGPNNPATTEDLKAALDGIVSKQGVFTLVFHPHGWITAEMIVELIDHATKTHGSKIKFLTFREAEERLTKNLLAGVPLREGTASLVDLDGDGRTDVVRGDLCRVWDEGRRTWRDVPFPGKLGPVDDLRFGRVPQPIAVRLNVESIQQWTFESDRWVDRSSSLGELPSPTGRFATLMTDLDGDGVDELVASGPRVNLVARWGEGRWRSVHPLPEHAALVDANGADGGLRLVDLDEDGYLDLLISTETLDEIHLFESFENGWSRTVPISKKLSQNRRLPAFVKNGSDQGVWFADRHLWMQNEDTSGKPNVVDRRSFNQLLEEVEPRWKNPKAALRSFRVAPGFRIETVAAEPLVRDPIAFDWSEDGRLWVVEMGDYPLGIGEGRKGGGSIRVLSDRDRDGRYDHASTFLDGLAFPTGVMPWRKGVLISAAPDILYAEDADGDGRAEVVRPILTGFTPGNPKHRVNGFSLGLDGWVYVANGDSGGTIKSVVTQKMVSISGRDLRFRPDTGEVEAESGQTQFGRARDDWGRWFGNNNSNWAWHYVLSEADLARNPAFRHAASRQGLNVPSRLHPVSRTTPRFNVPSAANHVTSANSPTPYRDDRFGPEYSRALFVSEPVHNLIRRIDVVDDGPTVRGILPPGNESREFLASSDNWFRPAGLKTGPDGGLWLADMYRAVIEHPEWIPKETQARIDLRAGADLGRIYRVVPVDSKPFRFDPLSGLTIPQLVAKLDDPNGWTRDTAQRLLMHENAPASLPLLANAAATFANPKGRLQALHLYALLGGTDASFALNDPHPMVRRAAVRLALPAARTNPKIAKRLLAAADDAESVVRFEVALAMGDWDDPRAGAALARVAWRDRDDPWFRAAVLTSARPHAALLLGELLAKSGERPPSNLLDPLFLSLRADQNQSALEPLREALARPGDDRRFADWQLSGAAGLAQASRDGDLLGRRARFANLLKTACAEFVDIKIPEPRRMLALLAFTSLETDLDSRREAIVPLLSSKSPPELRNAAVAALAKLDDPKIPSLLLQGWRGHAPAMRDQVLEALLTRPSWTRGLLSSLEDTCTPASEIDFIHRDRLIRHGDAEIAARARKVFDATEPSERSTVVAAYLKADVAAGRADRGEALYLKHCSVCHRMGGRGAEVGPDLTTVGDRSVETLVTAILDPNRAFESRYASYAVDLLDGRVLNGLIAAESANAITLKKSDGKDEIIPRSEIEAVVGSGRSMMPEGFEREFDPGAMVDLVAFLRASPPPPKSLAGNRPTQVAPSTDGVLRLDAASAEIRGASLVYETTYQNLGYWTSVDDRAAWSVERFNPGRYEVVLHYSRPDESTGDAVLVSVGEAKLAWRIAGTGSWDVYRKVVVGEIDVKAGADRVQVQAASAPSSALLDLKSIEFRPVD